MTQTFVVVGAGLAAANAVVELRKLGYDGRLVVFGEEPHLPYERPPLSKGYLLGNDELDSVFVQPPEWFDDHDVDLRLGARVESVDLDERSVTAGAVTEPFDRLLLATGASPRHLAMADASGAPVAYLRTIEDSQRLKATFGPGRRVVVVGGGWIGLETAAAARLAGAEVTVVESLGQPLLRVLGPEVAAIFADLHRRQGVDVRTNASVTAMDTTGGRGVVHLADGAALEADLLIVGVGVTPNVGLAESAGLATDNGVLVDERLTTSHPDVLAAGDVANALHPTLGRIRVEHWDNAIEQGKVAAHNLLGHGVVYDRTPYFFTDQYDLGMEYVGHVGPDGYDEVVVRGDVERLVFTAFWLRDQTVLAGMHANDWDAIDEIRRIVGRPVDVVSLRDPATGLEDVATG